MIGVPRSREERVLSSWEERSGRLHTRIAAIITILALHAVLSSTGRGSDIMVPMAIPSFGGMLGVLISVFVVPTLYCLIHEHCLPVDNGYASTFALA